MQYLARTALAFSLLTACTSAQGEQPAPISAPSAAQSVPDVPRKNGKPDFNGVWVMASYDLVWLPQEHNPPYTPEIQAEMDRFRTQFDPKVDDPAQLCVRMGMPWRMLNRARDYPVEIYQNPDRIIMLFEGHDDYRSIRLDRTTVPENLPALGNGWSNAKWDGDTLVITTSNLTARTTINPLQRSESAEITERWTLKKHPEFGDVVDIDITMTDPERYTAPIKAHNVYKRAAPGIEVGGYNCADALWEEYLVKREAEIAAKKHK
ncbi:MAG TPA: hypothetical protein PK680_05280 [Novosphingobium sp.]|jgi:hypothetical protein|nr:hypothetical protein [Novosphingobium sp.]